MSALVVLLVSIMALVISVGSLGFNLWVAHRLHSWPFATRR